MKGHLYSVHPVFGVLLN
jgi:hypothetical protein